VNISRVLLFDPQIACAVDDDGYVSFFDVKNLKRLGDKNAHDSWI
jgi:hypothetical protein